MIRFQNVTKDFGGETPALTDLSFSVQPGEFVLLTGHSGSGKTTLLKLITKEYLPTEGEIEFDSQELNDLKGSAIAKHRQKIGVIYQDYRLLPELNVWENVALPLEITGKSAREIEERVTDLLELVQLTSKAYVFPSQLSGGEAQRIGIARALATAPKLLLADEPTGNLDPDSTLMIAKLFDKIHELGTTILFATHDVSILNELKHRRLHLEKGRIVEDTADKTVKKAASSPLPHLDESLKPKAAPEKKAEKTDAKSDAESASAKKESIHAEPKGEAKQVAGKFRWPWQKKKSVEKDDNKDTSSQKNDTSDEKKAAVSPKKEPAHAPESTETKAKEAKHTLDEPKTEDVTVHIEEL